MVTTYATNTSTVIADAVAESVEAITVEVFVDDDGEGAFDVWAVFEGKDVYVLNRPIDDVRNLFGVHHTESGPVPAVPWFAPGGPDFDLVEAIVEVVAPWVDQTWRSLARTPAVPFDVRPGPDC